MILVVSAVTQTKMFVAATKDNHMVADGNGDGDSFGYP